MDVFEKARMFGFCALQYFEESVCFSSFWILKITITRNFLVLSGTLYLVLPLTCTTG